MKKILLLKLILFISLFSKEFNDYIHNNYYCVTNEILKTIILQDDEYIFYGDYGGVLRTYDGGDTWHQEFIGTHHFINDMIYVNNILYGVTSGGELLISKDKGFSWKISLIKNTNLSKIVKIEEFLITVSNSNELLISNDNGKSFSTIYSLSDKTISELFIFKESLLIKVIEENEENKENKNLLYKSSDYGKNWEKVELPNQKYENKFNVRFSGDRVVLFNDETFAEIKDNFSFDFYDVKEKLIFDLAFNDDNFYLVNYHGDSLTFFINHYSQKERKITSKYVHNKLGLTPSQYIINNTCSDSKHLIITTNQKTIIKFENKGSSPNILSSYVRNQSDTPYFLHSDFWYFSSDLKNNGIGGNFIISKNKGKTFNFSNHFFYDTTRTLCENNNAFPTNLVFDEDNNLFFSLRFSDLCVATYYPYTSYKSNLDINFIEPFVEYSEIGPGDRKKIITKKENNFIAYYLHERDNKIFFFELNENIQTTKISELDSINYSNADMFLSFFFEGNDIYMIGLNSIPSNHIFIYKTQDFFKSWDIVLKHNISIYESPNGFFKSKNGKYYLMLSDALASFKFLEIDLNSKDVKTINYQENDNESNGSQLVGNNTSKKFIYKSNEFLEDMTFLHTTRTIENQNQAIFKRIIAKLSVYKNEIIIDTLINLSDNFFKYKTQKDNLTLFMLSTTNNIFIPIEDTTLIKSVERQQPPPIWTYPPYPNPVKDRLKMQFYSAMMGEIAKLKVELIHIGTGRVYHIDKYGLNIIDDNWGEIEIDITGYIRGAYLINFKLGDGNKSEGIIIE